MKESFTCAVCGETKQEPEDSCTTGYGVNEKGEKICFACCGKLDTEEMENGRAPVLYLSKGKDGTWTVTNWPGTLRIPVSPPKKGRHNIAGSRYDVWFPFAGRHWHGVQYGEWTQVVHVKEISK